MAKYQQPRFTRRKPPFEHKPITEPGIYEVVEYDPFDVEIAKENGKPASSIEPMGKYTIIVFACDDNDLLWTHYPDGTDVTYLKEWGSEEWGGWSKSDDPWIHTRKIATNPNLLYRT